MRKIDYSIIIPFFNNINLLKSCLTSISNYTQTHGIEIIIINDNPDYFLKHFDVPAIVINNKCNYGYSQSCNIAAQIAKGKYLIFIDSDIIVTEKWLDYLIILYYNNTKLGAVSSKILKLSTGRLETFGVCFNEIDVIKPFRGGDLNNPFIRKDRFFQAITSACMLIPKTTFTRMNGFDERMYNCYSDLDLSIFMDAVIEELANGNTLEFRDFGVFKTKIKGTRMARNPRTGEKVVVESHGKVHFKPGRVMKKRVGEITR